MIGQSARQFAEKEIDFAELYDAYTSAEIQAYEDMGFCPYGQGGKFIEDGLISGISSALKLSGKGVKVIGVESEKANSMEL